MVKYVCALLLAALSLSLSAQRLPVGTVLPTDSVPVHDPVIIREGSQFYLFHTGNGISVWSSRDLKKWKKEASVFDKPPAWAVAAIPGFNGHIWAPDIQYVNGLYFLYYSVSRFGKNTSCIGLAVNKTLDPTSSQFEWKDRGLIIQSVPGRDLWNAIDPNFITDAAGTHWLSFGSYWGGVKLVKLDETGAVAKPEEWYTIARRPRSYDTPDSSSGSAAIEAPFIFRKDSFYYLFVSFDVCCKGVNSTYKIVVGRSKKVMGPYLDREGKEMGKNGGSIVAQGNDHWHGLGHNAVYTVDGRDLLICHGYDAGDKGRSKLILRELRWDHDGWPAVTIE